jgi:chromosome segregation ATPase
MSKFQEECYAALNRLKEKAMNGVPVRINKDSVSKEASKGRGAIREITNAELSDAIRNAEEDRRKGLLGIEDNAVQYREYLEIVEDNLAKSEEKINELEAQIEKMSGVMLSLLYDAQSGEEERDNYKDRLKKAEERIDNMMELIKPIRV